MSTRNELLQELIANLARALPAEIAEGLRAITTQSYTEANVKNGRQYAASSYFTGLTAGETIDYIIIVGAKPIAIKAQYIALKNGGDILIDWYRGPTYTGGTDLSALVTNQSDINPVAPLAVLIGPTPTDPSTGNYAPDDASKPTVTALGTRIQPTLVELGTTGLGGSTLARNTTIGLEQNLAPYTTYLYRRTFRGATDACFGFSTWYEGDLDLPL